jgi:hypothetical protein
MTKKEKLLRIIAKGRSKSVAELERRTGLKNVSATISELWGEGYPIVGFYRQTNAGPQYRYKLVEPSASMLKEGFYTVAQTQANVLGQ